MNALLDISHIDMVFPTPKGPFTALQDVSLQIKKGEFVSLIGHSGCGKSTVLNVVAGLHQATNGVAAITLQTFITQDCIRKRLTFL